MTRDEARQLVRDCGLGNGKFKSYDEVMVDALSALGILKLDEPKGVEDKFKSAVMITAGLDEVIGEREFRTLQNAIENAGLRIVEK